jgi:hypothetical protein
MARIFGLLKSSFFFSKKRVFKIFRRHFEFKKKFLHKTYILVEQTNCKRVFENSLEFVDLAAKTNFDFCRHFEFSNSIPHDLKPLTT